MNVPTRQPLVRLLAVKIVFLLAVCVACQSGTEANANDAKVAGAATAKTAEKAPAKQATPATTEGEPRLVFYAAGDCEPCDKFKIVWAKVLQQAPAQFPDLALQMVNCDQPENQEQCSKADEYGYPTVFLYREGQPPLYFDDPDTFPALMSWIERNLK